MLMGAWDLCFEKWKIGSENVTDRSRGELQPQRIKHSTSFVVKVPGDILMSQLSKGNHDSGVVVDKPMVEVSKSKECLDVLNFLGFQPVEYSLNFGRVHR
jgi:hypothetical protein